MKELFEFCRLDQIGASIAPLLNQETKALFLEAVMIAGSIDALVEPYKSWCTGSPIPDDVLEK